MEYQIRIRNLDLCVLTEQNPLELVLKGNPDKYITEILFSIREE